MVARRTFIEVAQLVQRANEAKGIAPRDYAVPGAFIFERIRSSGGYLLRVRLTTEREPVTLFESRSAIDSHAFASGLLAGLRHGGRHEDGSGF